MRSGAHGEGLASPSPFFPRGQEPAARGAGGSRPQVGRTQAPSLQSPAPGLPPSASSHPEGTLLPRLASLGPQTGFAGGDAMGSAQGKDVLPATVLGGTAGSSELSRAASEFGWGREGGWSAQSPPPGSEAGCGLRSGQDTPALGRVARLPSGERQDSRARAPLRPLGPERRPLGQQPTPGAWGRQRPGCAWGWPGSPGQLTGPDANWTRGEVAEGSQPGAELGRRAPHTQPVPVTSPGP